MGLLSLVCLLALGLSGYYAAAQLRTEQVEADWRALAKTKDKARLQRIAERSRKTLGERPLDVRSASLLGMTKEVLGDSKGSEALMLASSKLSHRDSATNLWVFQHGVERGQYQDAFTNIDAYMRRYPNESAKLLPTVVAGAVRPGAMPAFAERLAAAPPWRAGFYDALARLTPKNPDAAFGFLSESMKRGSPPTRQELEGHLNRMVAAGRFEEAYLHWILLLPNEQASTVNYLNDGSFEGDGGYPPFGWKKTPGSTVERVDAFGRKGKGLRVGYDGFVNTPLPTQMMLLPPGRYRMTGDILTEDKDSVGRVAWIVACPGEPLQIIAQQPAIETKGQWRRFTLNFAVPDKGCAAQVAGAMATPGVRRVPVAVWFDNITLARLDAPA